MIVDRVIFCWDGHPDYAGMFGLQRRLYAKLGVEATLLIVGDDAPGTPGSIRLNGTAQTDANDGLATTSTPTTPAPTRRTAPT